MINVTVLYYPKHLLLESLINYQTLPLINYQTFQNSFNGYWNLSTNFRTPCPALLRWYNKELRRSLIISNFTKGDTFFVAFNKKIPLRVISRLRPLFLHPQKKAFLLPFSLAQRIIYLDTHLKKELTDLLLKLPECSLFPQAEQKEKDGHFYNG